MACGYKRSWIQYSIYIYIWVPTHWSLGNQSSLEGLDGDAEVVQVGQDERRDTADGKITKCGSLGDKVGKSRDDVISEGVDGVYDRDSVSLRDRERGDILWMKK